MANVGPLFMASSTLHVNNFHPTFKDNDVPDHLLISAHHARRMVPRMPACYRHRGKHCVMLITQASVFFAHLPGGLCDLTT
jgi:hypothetical protein